MNAKNGKRLVGSAVIAVSIAMVTAGCMGDSGSNGHQSASSAQKDQNKLAGTEADEFSKAVPYPYANQAPSNPLERQNLKRRLLEYNSSGDTNYVYLLNFQGEPIGYYVIKGKVSSTDSSMTSTDINVDCSDLNNSAGQACTNRAIGDDGTYGSEEGGQNGIFFYTAAGNLVETNDPFWVVSAQPIKLYKSAPQLDAK